LENGADFFYQSTFFDETSVCSQWPLQQCNEQDGRFVDGYVADSSTAALNIGQYQSSAAADLDADLTTTTIKLILTPDDLQGTYDPVYLLSYFNTTFNQAIEPGDFLWPSDQFVVPLRSPQIFADYLDIAMYEALLEPIEGYDYMKTARIQTTTIDNPSYSVVAGTPVDILIVQLDSGIPTEIIGLEEIDVWKGRLADLAKGIASSSELLARVQDFVS
jgi:hypothetical protein